MSHFDNPAGPNRLPALVPLPELVPFMEQVSKVARFMTATSEIGTAAVYPDLSASIEEGARLIKEYRDKHAKALSELEKQTSEWTNSIDLREAEAGALDQRKDQAELELTTKRADLARLQSSLENSEELLQDAKSQLELAKADLTSTERQRKDHRAKMTDLQLEELNLRATRTNEDVQLRKRAFEIETHSKSVYTLEEQVKFREMNVKAREDAILRREVQSNMARIKAEKDRDEVEVEIEALSTQKRMLQASVNDLEVQAITIRANLTWQLRGQAEEKSRLDKKRNAMEQLTERWNAQKEDLRRQRIEVEEARQLSEAMQYNLEEFREKLNVQLINIYADKKALERGQESIERERLTVVTYAKGLEEMVLKEDPAYVPPEIEDDRIRTHKIYSALVEKFDNVNKQMRQAVRERDRIRLQNTDLLEELGQLRWYSYDQCKELLCENDTVKKSYRRKDKELTDEQRQCTELRQQVADHLRARWSADDLVMNLQRDYDQMREVVNARKALELEYQKATNGACWDEGHTTNSTSLSGPRTKRHVRLDGTSIS